MVSTRARASFGFATCAARAPLGCLPHAHWINSILDDWRQLAIHLLPILGMKKFIGKLTIFFVLVVGLYTALFATYAAIHPPRNNYFHAAHDKEKLLQSRPAPRVVFVGGSSVAFGINSGLIGKRCAL